MPPRKGNTRINLSLPDPIIKDLQQAAWKRPDQSMSGVVMEALSGQGQTQLLGMLATVLSRLDTLTADLATLKAQTQDVPTLKADLTTLKRTLDTQKGTLDHIVDRMKEALTPKKSSIWG